MGAGADAFIERTEITRVAPTGRSTFLPGCGVTIHINPRPISLKNLLYVTAIINLLNDTEPVTFTAHHGGTTYG